MGGSGSNEEYEKEEQEVQKEIEAINPDTQTQEKLSQLRTLNKVLFQKPYSCKRHYDYLQPPSLKSTSLFDLYLHRDFTFDLIGLRIFEQQNDSQEQEQHFHFVGVYSYQDNLIHFFIGLQAAYIKQKQSIPTA